MKMRVVAPFLVLCMVFVFGLAVGLTIKVSAPSHYPHPHWACKSEDEVVVINDKCVHVDTLTSLDNAGIKLSDSDNPWVRMVTER